MRSASIWIPKNSFVSLLISFSHSIAARVFPETQARSRSNGCFYARRIRYHFPEMIVIGLIQLVLNDYDAIAIDVMCQDIQ